MSLNVLHKTTLHNDGFDFGQVTADDVHFAFMLRAPFRFRVSSPFHCRFENRGEQYDIWIRNKSNTASDFFSEFGTAKDYYSRVVIIAHKSKVSRAEVEDLQRCKGAVDNINFAESSNKQLSRTLQALNAFIVGYHNATGELLHALTEDAYMSSVLWQVTLVGIPLSHWTADTIGHIFDLRHKAEVLTSVPRVLGDLPPDVLEKIPQEVDRLNSHYFYELAFEAKSKKNSGDDVGALLLAVAALEGAHSAFVTNCIASMLPVNRACEDKNLEEIFIKELGFTHCNKLTPYLFLKAQDRPTEDLIQAVATAVKYRNEIMHALRNSAGKYRIWMRTAAELNDAYLATITLYDLYRCEVEKLSQ